MYNEGINKPLLSICIPTYNRADYLRNCIESIVNQKEFDEKVEIVISDNNSTDNTETVVKAYAKNYANIHYFKNEDNVVDLNYVLALKRGNGCFRKIVNDRITFLPNTLKKLLSIIEASIDERPQIIFLNQKGDRLKKVTSFDEYILTIKYNITWIGAFSAWEDDCSNLDLFENNVGTNLGQVFYLLDNFERRGRSIIVYNRLFESTNPIKKDISYGLFRVFHDTFLGLIEKYVSTGKISERALRKIKKDLLIDFFAPWLVNIEKRPESLVIGDERLSELIDTAYENEPYYAIYKCKLTLLRIKADIKKYIGKNA